jgi:hypothetical protein
VRRAVLCLPVLLLLAAAGSAQWRSGIREGAYPPRFVPPAMPDRAFTICRLMYESGRWEPLGMGWRTDYPYAERNLMIRLSELTLTSVSFDARQEPNHYVVRLTDDALFQCPFLIASDVGTISLGAEESARLRAYLLKGGFLWVDDFWGPEAWEQWQRELARALPTSEYPIQDVPLSDPVFQSLYTVPRVPQIPSIQFWRRSGRSSTSERGAESPQADFRAVRDADGRIMVVMTHNTDIADSWEREGEDEDFFYRFSPEGYALGIDVLLHAMTH